MPKRKLQFAVPHNMSLRISKESRESSGLCTTLKNSVHIKVDMVEWSTQIFTSADNPNPNFCQSEP